VLFMYEGRAVKIDQDMRISNRKIYHYTIYNDSPRNVKMKPESELEILKQGTTDESRDTIDSIKEKCMKYLDFVLIDGNDLFS